MPTPPALDCVASDIALDAHVHLHEPAIDLAVLATAVRNFAALCPVASQTAALMLAEMSGHDAFSRLLERAADEASPLSATRETTSLWFSDGEWRVLVVAGRQIVTAERLEVLALGTRAIIEDGLPLGRVLECIAIEDALPVLPWACGKWIGARGRLVERTIAHADPSSLFIGDNSGRPAFWPAPIFDRAARRGMALLPGTDPLPLDGEWQRVGRFGCVVRAALSKETPVSDLKRVLRAEGVELRRYGELETPARFVRNQLRLRLSRAAIGRSSPGR